MDSTSTKVFKSKRVYLENGNIGPASIVVKAGKIEQIIQDGMATVAADVDEVVDVGELLLMPGVVDSHVHVNEPGRTDWEGFNTATRAAAAGGITTIVDMPLNSVPPTTSVEALKEKVRAASGKCWVHVAFWGGVVPGNQLQLRPMIRHGVRGFKCFMIDSGMDNFPCVSENDIREALQQLKGQETVLLFHAEIDVDDGLENKGGLSCEYDTFLQSRPSSMEVLAIRTVCRLAEEFRVPCHIVHLSAAEAIPVIREARRRGVPVTVETTHHYLSLQAEAVPQGATQFKCCPPIRGQNNQEALWAGVRAGDIDMVVSDHSPCTPDIKLQDTGDFMKAWGGIASLQFGLSLLWTNAEKRGLTLTDLVRLLCENTAKLAGLQNRKAAIKPGYDADFVIWDPNATFKVVTEAIHHKNKITPYLDQELRGRVHMTVVGGHMVYNEGKFSDKPAGDVILQYDDDQMVSP